MKKQAILLLTVALAFCCMFALTACGKKPDEAKTDEVKGTQGLIYQPNDDGQGYTLIGIGSATETDIVIPDKYNNLPVTRIGDSAFNGYSKLTSVTIPDSFTYIGVHAFCD